ncbi:MAG: prenyltransferase/squalene oxidase repeat-containing protein [Planctomycetaceae bacterium]
MNFVIPFDGTPVVKVPIVFRFRRKSPRSPVPGIAIKNIGRIVSGCVVGVLVLLTGHSRFVGAQEGGASARPQGRPAKSVETSGQEMMTPVTLGSIEKGLEFLASRQHADGSFGSGSVFQRNVAVTSLCGLAFISAGHTPGRGEYGDVVDRSIQFILASTRASGYIIQEESPSHGPMYGHGFATMYLAEVYGMTEREEIREKLQKAVKLIIQTQNKEGGWRYFPDSNDADLSVTVCQIMALRAARNAGIFVPKNTVDRCIEYVQKCQNADGSFRYLADKPSESSYPLTAAGIVALNSSGVYEGPELRRSIDYLMRALPNPKVVRHELHYFYGQYYSVQAMWQAGGSEWEQWYPAIRDDLIRKQFSNGSWDDPQICTEYGTAMACIVLQIPNQYIPIFQR